MGSLEQIFLFFSTNAHLKIQYLRDADPSNIWRAKTSCVDSAGLTADLGIPGVPGTNPSCILKKDLCCVTAKIDTSPSYPHHHFIPIEN